MSTTDDVFCGEKSFSLERNRLRFFTGLVSSTCTAFPAMLKKIL